ncbi:unnamed protein product [Rotaria socialis]|uniref:SCP domain-containing protein n=1 Tax=Rotaria socialis TaxID=392032 RepID=A0A820ERD0_9BILA|nr:unnamed protein product [Rotaria socialis]CAF3382213.1 unnamed protein product [Rotaria socialis]CAF4172213.1 unnamed protein product [Rotaria socialis]CAF4250218.1 unnamed protein product [Rotaria socialis]
MARPTHNSNLYYDRRFIRKPRYRYQHPLDYYVDMGTRVQRRTMLTTLVPTQRRLNGGFHAEMLELHNQYRARHCAPPLSIDKRLNQIAQSYAEHLAATSKFEHSGNKLGKEPLGENLYMQWMSNAQPTSSAKKAVKSWYDEVALHNFRRPTFSAKTGHFTQLVWKSSKLLGAGIAFSADKRTVYVVTNYYPAGNMMGPGSFERNVLEANC